MPVFLPPLRTPMITLCISRLRLSHGTCIRRRVIAIAGRGEGNRKRLWSTGLYYVCSDRTVTQQTKALSWSIEVPDNKFKQLTAREKQSFGAALLSLQKMKNLFYGQASTLIRCTINLTSKKGLESIDRRCHREIQLCDRSSDDAGPVLGVLKEVGLIATVTNWLCSRTCGWREGTSGTKHTH